MSNPAVPPLPWSDDDPAEDHITRGPDGETVVDPDLNEDLINSAEADRLATREDDDEALEEK